MSDNIKKRQGPFMDERDAELTTADLAGAGEASNEACETDSHGEDARNERSVREQPVQSTLAGTSTGRGSQAVAAVPAKEQETGPLFSGNEANEFRARWDTIQVAFVDEPRQAVQRADSLVAETMKRLAEMFAEERKHLESQWDQGENVSTEDLRQALRRYRSFFGRLLSV
jgi:hypothetical protein